MRLGIRLIIFLKPVILTDGFMTIVYKLLEKNFDTTFTKNIESC